MVGHRQVKPIPTLRKDGEGGAPAKSKTQLRNGIARGGSAVSWDTEDAKKEGWATRQARAQRRAVCGPVRAIGKRPDEIRTVEDLQRLVGREGDINSAEQLEQMLRGRTNGTK
jgi:hypothetical protein